MLKLKEIKDEPFLLYNICISLTSISDKILFSRMTYGEIFDKSVYFPSLAKVLES